MYNVCSWLVRPPGITAKHTFNSTPNLFVASATTDLNWSNNNRGGFSRRLPVNLHQTFLLHGHLQHSVFGLTYIPFVHPSFITKANENFLQNLFFGYDLPFEYYQYIQVCAISSVC